MDKRLILAVAGSGKTTYILNKLSLEKRSLVVTYTLSNYQNLREGILSKFGYFPDNIRLYTYFSFLYAFCFRPFLYLKINTKGITFKQNPNRFERQGNKRFFCDNNGRLYSNRIAKFIEVQGVLDDVNLRISKYFENFYIDEVQDLAGHDFNFLKSIAKANIEMVFVGDFYQHTYDTSRDGNVNNALFDDYERYKTGFVNMGFTVDTESLKMSFRCSPTICRFIKEKIGIEITSSRKDETKKIIVDTEELADEIYLNKNIVKLFYKENYKYGCSSKNWGECKGENKYQDVCVVLNRTTLVNFEDNLNKLPPQTKNKLYVACSRASNNLYFVPFQFYEKYKV